MEGIKNWGKAEGTRKEGIIEALEEGIRIRKWIIGRTSVCIVLETDEQYWGPQYLYCASRAGVSRRAATSEPMLRQDRDNTGRRISRKIGESNSLIRFTLSSCQTFFSPNEYSIWILHFSISPSICTDVYGLCHSLSNFSLFRNSQIGRYLLILCLHVPISQIRYGHNPKLK